MQSIFNFNVQNYFVKYHLREEFLLAEIVSIWNTKCLPPLWMQLSRDIQENMQGQKSLCPFYFTLSACCRSQGWRKEIPYGNISHVT